jgi:hypothetical protein
MNLYRFPLAGRALHFAGVCALILSSWACNAGASDAPSIDEFAWRGTLALPPGASLVRVAVPVQALLQMHSNTAADLRVFNATGAVVPFALLGRSDLSQVPPAVYTRAYTAYPLFAAHGAAKPVSGAVQVQLDSGAGQSSAWVRWDTSGAGVPASGATAQPLQAALFDLRTEEHSLDALALSLELPHNALVPVTVASSADLKDWTPVATKGPLYTFDGPDAPVNSTLEFRQPMVLKGRYLRLSWPGQTGVTMRSLTARVASPQTTPESLRWPLPPGVVDGNSLSWMLPFATPVAAVHLQAARDNTLVPVRILGRNDAAQPWRTLASSVVYRLDTVGQGNSNPPTPLHGASLRGLRVEAGKGLALPEGGLQATLEFAPLHVAFLASGTGPFTLAAGRAKTQSATVDVSVLGSVSPAKLAELPLATVALVQIQTVSGLDREASHWLPEGVSLRTVLLWVVLGLGVLALGGVAMSLMRQLGTKPEKSE